MIAPMSSTIANAVRNIFRDKGILLPSSEITPNEKAMSVAIGIPQPFALGVPALKNTYIRAGKIIPPAAANIGKDACLKEDSSPTIISRLISRPTTKKNIAIRASLTQWSSDISSLKDPIAKSALMCQIS